MVGHDLITSYRPSQIDLPILTIKLFKYKINILFIWPMNYANGTVMDDLTTPYHMLSV